MIMDFSFFYWDKQMGIHSSWFFQDLSVVTKEQNCLKLDWCTWFVGCVGFLTESILNRNHCGLQDDHLSSSFTCWLVFLYVKQQSQTEIRNVQCLYMLYICRAVNIKEKNCEGEITQTEMCNSTPYREWMSYMTIVSFYWVIVFCIPGLI